MSSPLSRRARVALAALAPLLALASAPSVARGGESTDAEVGFDVRARYHVAVAGAPARGPADALVTIVEFSDFQCQYCRMASEMVAELQRLYPHDLRVVYRHSLLDPEDGTLAAEASAAAAAQGRFWAFHDRLFAEDGHIDRAVLESCAREIGLDLGRFRRDLDDARFRSAVRAENREAEGLGVSSTPAFFVNGRPIVGARGLGAFLALIEQERAAAAALVSRGVPRRDVYQRLTTGGLRRAGPISAGADEVFEPRLDPMAPENRAAGLGLPAERLGPDDALVTVVEFGDYRCGYCARMVPILAELKQQYGDDLRIVFRFLPLGGNPESRRLAEAAAAAGGQGRFWEMHSRLFAARGPIDRTSIEGAAAEIGLDLARYRAALDRRQFAAVVSRDAAEGALLGVHGTPNFFVNGEPVMGAASADQFRAVIDRKLAEARALVRRGVPRADVYREATGQKSGSRPVSAR